MKKVVLLFALVAFGVSVYAQSTVTRKLEKFTGVSAAEGIDVNLVKGSKYEAKITAKGIDMDDVLTDVSGSMLKIHLDGGNHHNVNVSVEVTFVSLNKVYASSAADIKSSSVIESESLDIEASSAADIHLEVKVKELDVQASSSADISLSGSADKQTVEASSASDYKAFDLVSKVADVSTSSAADANVNVTEELYANASSGGSVRYKGNPDKVKEHSSSGGDVEKY